MHNTGQQKPNNFSRFSIAAPNVKMSIQTNLCISNIVI